MPARKFKKQPQAIIFDMDGVLIDSEKFHFEIEALALKEFGVDLDTELSTKYTGLRFEEYFQLLINHFQLFDFMSHFY